MAIRVEVNLQQLVKDKLDACVRYYQAPSVSKFVAAMIEDYYSMIPVSQESIPVSPVNSIPVSPKADTGIAAQLAAAVETRGVSTLDEDGRRVRELKDEDGAIRTIYQDQD